jgi:hypothetical protein
MDTKMRRLKKEGMEIAAFLPTAPVDSALSPFG